MLNYAKGLRHIVVLKHWIKYGSLNIKRKRDQHCATLT